MGLIKFIKSLEPLWWSLFGLGGAIAAFLFPAHILIQGVFTPAGILPADTLQYENFSGLLHSPFVRIYFLALIVFPLYHAAHRIRMTLEDLRIGWLNAILPLLCYGGGTAISISPVVVILRLS